MVRLVLEGRGFEEWAAGDAEHSEQAHGLHKVEAPDWLAKESGFFKNLGCGAKSSQSD